MQACAGEVGVGFLSCLRRVLRMNSGPLQEQCVLLNTEPSLYSALCFSIIFIDISHNTDVSL